MQGCIVAGFKNQAVPSHNDVDTSVITGAIGGVDERPADPTIVSDQRHVRDTISQMDSQSLKTDSVSWDNAETGNQGIISGILERDDGDRLCRQFQTTRATYDGAHLYYGQICLIAPQVWAVTAFNRFE
ncbi:RT0821/Lpp0805 family surface protein [Bartonella tamiae]|uniref:Surface antigen domain-containing protein n=1 Tax=Bartonella tamiae Th239 TaxID=1094558 RepID=J1K0H6_9HYPH|nr:RT0821/Lpp0805 family surface protein [Bartonella tamiae]EJF90515.1 hypothetical protein ME5_00916 [Bartonella tamiae Th239]EJF93541.1 hypothetical protein MEG_00965 [Bartonella tamiae Th307]